MNQFRSYNNPNFSSRTTSNSMVRPRMRYSSSSTIGLPGGEGSRISMSNFRTLSSAPFPFGQQSSVVTVRGAGDKETMKDLNNRLDKYISRVRTLEESNKELEDKIKEELLKRGTVGGRDWSSYDDPLADLRAQIREKTISNAEVLLQIDNARLAADDFKVKYESELALRQGVEQDIAGLRKIIDDTNMSRLQLESQIDATTEELEFLKKNHEEDLAELRDQITGANVQVELNTPKGPDMNEIISKIREQYEKSAQKSRDDTDAWYQNKFDKLNSEVSQNTEALQEGKNDLTIMRREKQGLEVELQSLLNMNHTLENTLADTQNRYAQKVNLLNQQLLQLEAQLADLRAQAERQGAEYQALLNVKDKLEEEIATYHQLLGGEGQHQQSGNRPASNRPAGIRPANDSTEGDSAGGDRVEFSLEQALRAAAPPQGRKVIVLNQELVDGQVVSQKEAEVDQPNGEDEGSQSPAEQDVGSD